MTDERIGEVVAQVSEITETGDVEIIDSIPEERPYIVIFWVPDDDGYPGVDQFHDVVIYHSDNMDSHGPYTREPAAKHAVEESRETGYPLANSIFEYYPYDL